MAETVIFNAQVFAPFNGGDAARLAVSGTSNSAEIPGLAGGEVSDKTRVAVTNPHPFSIFVKLGTSGVVAVCTTTRCSYEVIAGSTQLLKPPIGQKSAVWMAAITAGETGYTSACAGEGI